MRNSGRVAWLTPLSSSSDIGAHSLAILSALSPADKRRVVVFRDDPKNTLPYTLDLPTIALSESFDIAILDMFDFVIANIGNNSENHAIINKIALTRPVIVVVHDIAMAHYFAHFCLEVKKRPDLLAQLLVFCHGKEALDVLETSSFMETGKHIRYAFWDSTHVTRLNLLKPFFTHATGVIVHSTYARDIVHRDTDAPVFSLFLPGDKKSIPNIVSDQISGRRVVFASIGHIGRSKFLHLAISALAASSYLRESSLYIIAGHSGDTHYLQELQQLVRDLSLDNLVKFELDVSEAQLLQIKANTDVFVNLRYPNTESASGSLTEQMACGKPVIVYNSGCYSELPSDCVLKIDDISTHHGLESAMTSLALSPEYRQDLGRAARKRIDNQSAERYGHELLQWLDGNYERVSHKAANRAPSYWLLDDRETPAEIWTELQPNEIGRLLILLAGGRSSTFLWFETLERVIAEVPREKMVLSILRYFAVSRTLRAGMILNASDFLGFDYSLTIYLLVCLRKGLFARLVYCLILFRMPSPVELSDAEPLILNISSAVEFVKKIALCDEASQKSPAILDRLNSIELLCSCRTYLHDVVHQVGRLERRQEFRSDLAEQALPFLVGPWHGLENDGVWSAAKGAEAVFVCSEWGKDRILKATIRVAGTGLVGPKQVRFLIDGIELARRTFENDDEHTVQIVLGQIVEDAVMHLEFDVNDYICLADYGGTESRKLGVFLQRLELIENFDWDSMRGQQSA